MAYSLDLRQRAVKRVKNGHSVPETAALYEISPATLYRWFQRSDLAPTVVNSDVVRLTQLPSKPMCATIPTLA